MTKSKKARRPPIRDTNGHADRSNGAHRRFTGDTLVIKGARQHNLKNVDLTLPKKKLIVVTGPSGSGKSSLVFDTI
jgi:excinuclease ABC subunit A